MRARKFNRKIEIYQTSKTVNDFGDSIVTSALLTTTFAQILTPTNGNSRNTDFGITDTSNRLILNLRKRNDINYNSKDLYFVYNNEKYNIISEPINVGFENREINITVAKVPNNRDLDPINGQGNQYQHRNGQGG